MIHDKMVICHKTMHRKIRDIQWFVRKNILGGMVSISSTDGGAIQGDHKQSCLVEVNARKYKKTRRNVYEKCRKRQDEKK
jgi:hypothetical protein